jgi:prolyl oligopeptidase
MGVEPSPLTAFSDHGYCLCVTATPIDLSTDNSDSLTWQGAQDVIAQKRLADLAERDRFAELVKKYMVGMRQFPPTRRGDLWFRLALLHPDDARMAYVVGTSPDGEARVLFDPNTYSAEKGAQFNITICDPSPDGTRVAIGLDEGGKETPHLLLIDVESGELIPHDIPWVVYGGITWLPDSSGFWCSTRVVDEGGMRQPLYRYVFGQPLPEETNVDLDSPFTLVPEVSPNGRYVLLPTGNTEVRLDAMLYDGEQRPFLADVPGTAHVRFDGDDAIAILEDTPRGRGRVVRIPMATATEQSTWTELLAESDDVLRWIEVVGGNIVLGLLRDAAARLKVLDLTGAVVDEPDLPGHGMFSIVPAGGSAHPSLPMFGASEHEIVFAYSTYEQSATVYRYEPAARKLEVLHAPDITIDNVVVTLITATSSDGTQVPAHVVHRADLDLSIPQPTIVYGYGGYNLAKTPGFDHESAAWVQAGGIWVLAHLRGGSEFGPEWWLQGRRENKQLCYDDFYAVAERAIELGLTSRDRIAARGESNGGLLTAASIVQRPDLWAAVACDVPITDLIGYAKDPFFAIGAIEYGDPAVPEEAEWLTRVSPVHNVQPADYPNVLVTAGANDPRCPAWHSRVLVDAVQKANTGKKEIFLRVYEGQGHGAAGFDDTIDKSADWLAHVADVTGLIPC